MIDRILVPLDGSALAECVLPHTVALSKAFDARVLLVRVVGRSAEDEEEGRVVDPLGWQMRKSEADAYLEEVAGRLRDLDLAVERALLEGKPAERIVEFAHEQDVGLIVISSHGRSGLSEWNINSVVQKVILRAYKPILIVRAYHAVPEDLDELRYDRVLVPLDGSRRAECALPLASALVDFHHCRLLLAHVVSKPEMPRHAPLSDEEQALIERITERNKERGAHYLQALTSRVSVDTDTRLLVSENTAGALHTLVEEEDVDLVALSAHGYSGEARWAYGSIALNFIAYGATPLLIVQDIAEEEIQRTQAELASQERKGHA
jgi:nucleotide-binding universal stress UspA family protein